MIFSGVKSITIPEGKVKKITVVTSRIPSEYQEVEYIKAASGVGAYLNLGFAFEKAASIEIGLYNSLEQTQIFGAAENSGKLRCMITAPYSTSGSGTATFYGSTGSAYIERTYAMASGLNEFEFSLKKGELGIKRKDSATTDNSATTQGEYTMTSNLLLFAQNYNGTPRYAGTRQVYYFKYYDQNNNLKCDLVPCYRKSDGVIGMYDLARKMFLQNVGTGSFTKGADAGGVVLWEAPPSYTDLVPTATDRNGNILDGIGYRRNAKWSSGALITQSSFTAIGLIPIEGTIQHDIYMYGLNFSGTSHNNYGVFSETTMLGQDASIKDGHSGTYLEAVTKLGENYFKIRTKTYSDKVKFFVLSAVTVDGITPIVTIDEPIF